MLKRRAHYRIRKRFIFIVSAITVLLLLILPGVLLTGSALTGQNESFLLCRIPDTPPFPDRYHSGMELSKGKFLVASRSMGDSRFQETVVLLVEYDSYGAMGLIINRPSEIKLSRLFTDIEGLNQRADTVYVGGPVAMNQINILIQSGRQSEETRHVFADTYVSSSRVVFEQMIKETYTGERFRVYAGYAGWASGQLEREVLNGGWHVMEASTEAVFDKKSSEIWPELIRQSTKQQWVNLTGAGSEI